MRKNTADLANSITKNNHLSNISRTLVNFFFLKTLQKCIICVSLQTTLISIMSNKVLDTYYKNNRHIWVLVLSGAVIGTMIGLLATAFQLLLDFIFKIKLASFFFQWW